MKKIYFPTLLTFLFFGLCATVQGGSFIVKNAYDDIVIRQAGLQARSINDKVGKTKIYDGVTTVNYFPKKLGKPIVLFTIEDYFQLEQAGIQQVTTTINNEELEIIFYVDITRSNDKTKSMLPKYNIQDVYIEILSLTSNGLALKKDDHVTMSDTFLEAKLEEIRKGPAKLNVEWESWKNRNWMNGFVKKPESDQSDSL